MAFGKSKGGSHEKTTSNGGQSVDPTTFGRIGEMWNAGKAAGQAGPSPLVTNAAGYNTGMMGAGQAGLSALGGDPAAAAKLMNPYQQQVIDATNAQWNKTDQQSMNAVNDRATQAGAFGGSRHGVATGVALANNNMNRNAQVSGLLSSGYSEAMQRAGQLAGYGAYGSAQNANLGMGGVGSPQQWYAQQLRLGYNPTGTTQHGVTSTTGSHGQFDIGL